MVFSNNIYGGGKTNSSQLRLPMMRRMMARHDPSTMTLEDVARMVLQDHTNGRGGVGGGSMPLLPPLPSHLVSLGASNNNSTGNNDPRVGTTEYVVSILHDALAIVECDDVEFMEHWWTTEREHPQEQDQQRHKDGQQSRDGRSRDRN